MTDGIPTEVITRLEWEVSSLASMHSRSIMQSSAIQQLINTVRQLKYELPISDSERAFEKLQPLRKQILWLPLMFLVAADLDHSSLALLAKVYAIIRALEPISPESIGVYLSEMVASPLVHTEHILNAQTVTTVTSLAPTASQLILAPNDQFLSNQMNGYSNPTPISTFQHDPLPQFINPFTFRHDSTEPSMFSGFFPISPEMQSMESYHRHPSLSSCSSFDDQQSFQQDLYTKPPVYNNPPFCQQNRSWQLVGDHCPDLLSLMFSHPHIAPESSIISVDPW